MKKKILISCLAVIVLACGIVLFIFFKHKNDTTADTPVLVNPWNSRSVQYAICYNG